MSIISLYTTQIQYISSTTFNSIEHAMQHAELNHDIINDKCDSIFKRILKERNTIVLFDFNKLISKDYWPVIE